MASLLYRVGTGGDTTGDTSVKKIDEVNELGKNPTERAENLSLPREDRRLLTEASRFQQTLDNAQQVLLRSPWYAFVMKVAGFSNEPINKFWKETRDENRPLSNQAQLSQVAQINAAVQGEGDTQDLGRFLENRQYFFQSAEVRGYLYLTPICYSHVSESVQLLEKMSGKQLDVDALVGSKHSTYFARLVSLRIQLSRFLSGRYYSLSANYKRLLTQQGHLIAYFKRNLVSTPTPSRGRAAPVSSYFARLQ